MALNLFLSISLSVHILFIFSFHYVSSLFFCVIAYILNSFRWTFFHIFVIEAADAAAVIAHIPL